MMPPRLPLTVVKLSDHFGQYVLTINCACGHTRIAQPQTLARLARIDPQLLSPVKHRSAKAQADLTVIRARAGLVRARTALVNTARGLAKSYGERLRGCNVRNMNPEKAEGLSPELQRALEPLLAAIESLSERIGECNERIETLAQESYPQVALLKQVKGVGTLIALTFLLTLEDALRSSRQSAGFAVLWILGMINSINFIDGLDGLSSGVALIAALTLGTISLTGPIDQPAVALFCFALAGSLLGFLRWNLHPASIFLGTSGVMVIGYVLALLSILGSAKVAVALLVLGVPIIDTFWIIVRRVSEGRSPFSPDRGHIHHRLLDLGLSHGQTVLVIYSVCIALAVLSLVLSGTGQLYAFLGVFVIFGLGLYLLSRAAGGDGAA